MELGLEGIHGWGVVDEKIDEERGEERGFN
jgi:hypothetical protein